MQKPEAKASCEMLPLSHVAYGSVYGQKVKVKVILIETSLLQHLLTAQHSAHN